MWESDKEERERRREAGRDRWMEGGREGEREREKDGGREGKN